MKFSNQRFMTKNSSEKLPMELQMILLDLIEGARGKVKLDYLQIFRLSVAKKRKDPSKKGKWQRIVHEQEIPAYKMEIVIRSEEPVEGKVYVIDGGEYTTMMMAEDY